MWFFKRKKKPDEAAPVAVEADALLELTGRTVTRNVVPVVGQSILQLAERNKVDWMSNCKRGTCARCRCLVSEGMEHLTPPNEAEMARLEPEEREQGYRLGCQAKVARAGEMRVRLAPYFRF